MLENVADNRARTGAGREVNMGIAAVDAVARELMLFAAAGFLVGDVDDLLVDLVWIVGRMRARFSPDIALADLPRPPRPLRFAVFVAAWREEAVIGAMLRAALARIDHPDYRLYVGTYPNDAGTIAVVEAMARTDLRVRLVIGSREGPTTKADNLNAVWRTMRADDAAAGVVTEAIVIHDAEDVIHPDELTVHQAMLADADVVQIPVVPRIDPAARLVSATYADEFAESHLKSLPVRCWLGAGLPLAGVGCAMRVDALRRIAGSQDAPFDAASLVEDYEMGLKLAEAGCRARFARVRGADGSLVATRAYFPSKLDASVRQKARWMVGIALSGWDRIGWARPLAITEHWMRMRDRRAPLAVFVLAVAYLALLCWGASWTVHALGGTAAPVQSAAMRALLTINAGLLVWRMLMRMLHTASIYGWVEGVRSVPRVLVANYISLLAVRRALWHYISAGRSGIQRWDKTEHVFPDLSSLDIRS